MIKESLIMLVKEKYNFTEKKAIGLILSGNVIVDDKVITKSGIKINIDSNIRIKNQKEYVSRGAYKLLTAFSNFNINVENKICIDCGSSTGGFTEVLLEKGAQKVFSIDCGENQLDYSIRINKKVSVFENTKMQELKKSDIIERVTFAVMDVSFTSSIFLVKHLNQEFEIKEMVILIKPQFEYERLKERLNLSSNFNGVIENNEDRIKIIDEIIKEITELGLKVVGFVESCIKGAKGNIEYLFYLTE
jgi:23S rRNA (cytidine1920-2'-O)/16S rRNA (cytidine1409-2'-O)-methyltransferase